MLYRYAMFPLHWAVNNFSLLADVAIGTAHDTVQPPLYSAGSQQLMPPLNTSPPSSQAGVALSQPGHYVPTAMLPQKLVKKILDLEYLDMSEVTSAW